MSQRSRPSVARRIGMAIYGVIAAAMIATAVVFSVQSASAGSDLRSNLTFIAPAGVGGGWDSFAREQQQAMRAAGVVNNVQVLNIPGAGGTIGLGKFSTMEGQSTNIMATGTAMLGGIEMNRSPVTLASTRPLARVAEDYDVIVVPTDSPYTSVDDLVEDWRADNRGIVWTGGSAGSIDHLIIAALAKEVGVEPSQITFIPKSGGGEAIQTLLAGTTDVAVTGYNEVADQIEVGRVRALALSAPERLEGVDVPTLNELGHDVALVNWRGVLAPPGTSEEDYQQLVEILEETRSSEQWRNALERNRWVDSWMSGDEFEQFIAEDQTRISELVESLGL